MHPANAAPSACTGESPAMPALSIVVDAVPLTTANFKSPSQDNSTTVGGLPTRRFYRRRCGPRWSYAEAESAIDVDWDDGDGGDGTGRRKTGPVENTAFRRNQPSGRITSR